MGWKRGPWLTRKSLCGKGWKRWEQSHGQSLDVRESKETLPGPSPPALAMVRRQQGPTGSAGRCWPRSRPTPPNIFQAALHFSKTIWKGQAKKAKLDKCCPSTNGSFLILQMLPANFILLQREKQIKKTLRKCHFTCIDRYLQTNGSCQFER